MKGRSGTAIWPDNADVTNLVLSQNIVLDAVRPAGTPSLPTDAVEHQPPTAPVGDNNDRRSQPDPIGVDLRRGDVGRRTIVRATASRTAKKTTAPVQCLVGQIEIP